MSGSLNARTELAEGERAEPAGQTLCQLERREEVNPLVSGYSCLKGAGKKRENHSGFIYMMPSAFASVFSCKSLLDL